MKKITLTMFWILALLSFRNTSAQTTGVGFGTISPQALIHMENGHLKSTQTTTVSINGTATEPAIVPPFFPSDSKPNGLTPPIAPPTDVRGTIALQGSPINTASVARITFSQPYNFRPTVILTMAGTTAAGLNDNRISNLYTIADTTGFTVVLYTSDSTLNVIFNINYFVIE